MIEKCSKLRQNMRKAQTVPKKEVCAIPQNRNENFYSLLSNKKKIDRKGPETGKRQHFEIRAKSSKIVKNRPFHRRRALCAKNEVFADFRPDLKGSPFFLFLGLFYQFFFCLKAQNKKINFYFAESRISKFK